VSAIIIPMEPARTGRLMAQKASDLGAIARRLVASRVACGLRHTDLVAVSGITSPQLANWEGAKTRPRVDQLALVLPILGVTSDWVYFGDDRALPWEKREAIQRALDDLPDAPEHAAPTTRRAAG
jgi:transcriptional regulator with XRE-family HTH domain